MESGGKSAKAFSRTPFWYLKFIFASYAAAMALFMLAIIVSLPFGGPLVVGDHSGVIMFCFFVVVSPLVFRYLR
jgi:hypothetical protein